MPLTPEQQQAVFESDKSIYLVAGAGAGKTKVLVERIMHLISQGVSLNAILAMTFTNKAAMEMKERCASHFNHLAQTAEDPEASSNYQKLALETYAASFTTIDSFCSHCLRDFAPLCQIDPEFSVLSETENSLLVEEQIQKFISEIKEEEHESAHHYLTLLKSYSLPQIQRFLSLLIRKGPQAAHALLEFDETQALEELPYVFETLRKEKWKELFSHELTDVIHDARVESYDKWLFELRNCPSLPLAQFQIKLEELIEASPKKPSVKGKAAEEKERLKLAGKSVTELKKNLKYFYHPAFCMATNHHSLKNLSHLIELSKKCHEQILAAKHGQNAYSFADISFLAHQLITQNEHVSKSLQERYHYILVDEFQDTNLEQLEIISAIRKADNLFLVGDPKQSIYAFRGADVSIFNQMTQSLDSPLQITINLLHNFRTQKAVLDIFNRQFSHLFCKEIKKPYQVKYQNLIAGKGENKQDSSFPRAKLQLIEGVENTEQEKQALAKATANEIQSLMKASAFLHDKAGELRPTEYKDICILLSKMTHIQYFEEALQKEKIPYFNYSSRSFYKSDEVSDMFTLLYAFTYPHHDLPFASFLKLPSVGCTDALLRDIIRHENYNQRASLFTNLLKLKNLLPAPSSHFLDHMTRQFLEIKKEMAGLSPLDMLHHLDQSYLIREGLLLKTNAEQRIANLDKLFLIAYDFMQNSSYELTDLVDYLRHLILEKNTKDAEATVVQSEANHISILTVHASKGLEFPVVMMPTIHSPLKHQFDDLLMDQEKNPTYIGFRSSTSKGEKLKDLFYLYLEEEEKKKNKEEHKRLLYVAMTRAEDAIRLIGIKSKKRAKDSWQEWVEPELIPFTEIIPIDQLQIEEDQAKAPSFSIEKAVDRISFLTPFKEQPSLIQRHTVSALLDYETCPYLYYLKNILAEPSPKNMIKASSNKNFKTSLDAATLGIFIHKALEIHHPQRDPKVSFRMALAACGLSTLLNEKELNYLFGYFDKVIHHPEFEELHKESTGKKSYQEIPFLLQQGNVQLQGTIDRLMVSEKELLVIDYKTGARTGRGHRYQNQLAIYSLAMKKSLNQTTSFPLKGVLLYCADAQNKNSCTQIFQFSEEELEQTESWLEQVGQQIRKEEFDSLKEAPCDHCSYKTICKQKKGTLQDAL